MVRIVMYSDGNERAVDDEKLDLNQFLEKQAIDRLDKELAELRAENKRLKAEREALPVGHQFNLPYGDAVIEIPKDPPGQRREVKVRVRAAGR